MITKFLFKTAYCKLLLPALFLWPVLLSAQNGVTVSGLAIDAGTVTFNVSWNRQAMQDLGLTVWSDTVWVFVDYNKAGVMTRLPLASGATLTGTSASGFSRVEYASNNNQGVWVVGNARSASAGSFSATVRLLTATADFSGACVYASNYPPVGRYISVADISFTGTPLYDLVFQDGGGQSYTFSSQGTFTVPGSYTLASFIDKTGAPGRIISHAVYCLVDPGVIGTDTDLSPSCASYQAGEIGGEGYLSPSCASYRAGNIGGAGDALPGCALYRAGSIGGISFATSNCETYVAGLVGGAEDLSPSCASYAAGEIGGEGYLSPSCASYRAGNIGGRDDALPGCASYRAGSIGGVSFAGLM
jgi:hypothetical protein